MRKNIFRYVLLVMFALFSFSVAAQPQPSPPPPPGEDRSGDQPAPLGNGLAILAVLGLAYGAKKLYDARKDFNK
jgi:hypothetical protein